jgi:tripartite-type tricarboxylate transporter receptor subunit TctC
MTDCHRRRFLSALVSSVFAFPAMWRGAKGKTPYEFAKDFDLISLAVLTTLVIAVHPSVTAQNLEQLVALIKSNPGKYSYASPGTGTPGHLVGKMFRVSLDLVHVPFNSAGLAVGSTVGGHTSICFASPSPAAQQVIEGALRGLAVTSKTRSQALPDVPTTAELAIQRSQVTTQGSSFRLERREM